MKKILLASLVILALAAHAAAQPPTADDVLTAADDVVNAPLNMNIRSTMTVVDKDGYEKVREILVWQKEKMRMVRFVKPASERGIALLSTDSTTNYVYMPAYKKVRRIAAHVRNQTFMGTDFSQEDMAITRYADDFAPKLIAETDAAWELELTKKPGSNVSYSKLNLSILKSNDGIARIEYFDKKGDKLKVEVRTDFERFEDKYWCATKIVMTSVGSGHETRIENSDFKYDQDLSEDFFSQRNLKRPLR